MVGAQDISTFAGTGNPGTLGDGQGSLYAELDGISAGAIDDSGNFYIADFDNCLIRKITPDGIISTVAGTGVIGYSGDNGPATKAKISGPSGLAVDHEGNLFIADYRNNVIRKVTPAGIISTFAGTGHAGFSGNGGRATAAALSAPGAVAIDRNNNLYISDCDNNCVRVVTHAGIINNFAGNGAGAATGSGTFSGDGGLAINAGFNNPRGLAIDAAGNVYIADCFNQRIRKVTKAGIVTTIAGDGEAGFSKDSVNSLNSHLNYPNSIAVDSRGFVYISDHTNHRVRCVNNSHIIVTIAGTGEQGFGGEKGPANLANINGPSFVLLDHYGNLFIGDRGNNRIREVSCSSSSASLNAVLPSTRRTGQ